MGRYAHFVQFFEDDAVLVESISGFACAALLDGAASVVIATRPHLQAVEASLVESGIDLADARKHQQFITLDANQMLSRFMLDDMPDEERFVAAIEPLLRSAQARFRRISAFGEMVAILSAQGNFEAAVRLEQFWNNLARKHDFALFCAYPISLFEREEHAHALADICAEHSGVIHAHGV
jgi:hypothetical protein